MTTTFTRSLGSQPGYQMNPILDNSAGNIDSNIDQAFAVAGKFSRGRIDKAFQVTSGTMNRYLGASVSTLISRLNEANVQTYEAFAYGAASATVARLVPAASVSLKAMVATMTAPGVVSWAVPATAPATGFLMAVTHLECFNDGVTIELWAPEVDSTAGVAQPTNVVRLRLLDIKTAEELFSFTGSLDPTAVDDFGNSYYLPSVVSAQTDAVSVVIGDSLSIPVASNIYGIVSGAASVASANLAYFTEGGTSYASTDYDNALNALRYTAYDWGYMISGGTENQAFLGKMIASCFAQNRQLRFDVPGRFTPAAAISWMSTLNQSSIYGMAQWAPMIATDPVNGGKDYIGASGIKVGYACARNAQKDSNGLAPKNYPIAGQAYPVTRTGVIQKYTPTDIELSNLADAKINPVILKKYSAGSSYVFTDSLTIAKTTGLTKLEAVVDMATSVDDLLAAFGNEVIQLPLNVAIPKMVKYADDLLTAVETAGWSNVSAELGSRSYVFTCTRNTNRIDAFTNKYSVAYDGTTRAIFSTQSIVRTT